MRIGYLDFALSLQLGGVKSEGHVASCTLGLLVSRKDHANLFFFSKRQHVRVYVGLISRCASVGMSAAM